MYLPFGPVSSLTLGNGVDVTYSYDLFAFPVALTRSSPLATTA